MAKQKPHDPIGAAHERFLESMRPPTPPRRLRGVVRKYGVPVVATALLGVGAAAANTFSQDQLQGTEFSSPADALRQLQADAAAHGDDLSTSGPDQTKMEQDLRGASPVVMTDIAQRIVGIAAVHDGTFTSPDGSTISLDTTPLDGGNDVMEIDKTSPRENKKLVLRLRRTHDGTFTDAHFTTEPIRVGATTGGEVLDYDFKSARLSAALALRQADGSSMPGSPGAAVIVTPNSTLGVAAGPATAEVSQDMTAMYGVLDSAAAIVNHK